LPPPQEWGRGYLRRVWHAAMGDAPMHRADSRHVWADPLRYRVAVLGGLCGFAFLCLWFIVAGMSRWVAAGFFAMTLLFAVVYTRGRAESGLASLGSSPYWQAKSQFTSFLGSDGLLRGGNPANLVLLGSLWFLHFGFYCQGMAFQFETLKMGGDSGIKTSHMATLAVVAMLVGLMVTFHTQLRLGQEWGMNTLAGSGGVEGSYYVSQARSEFAQVSGIVAGNKLPRDWGSIGYTAGGSLATLLLVAARTRMPGLPLHPLGLVLTVPYGCAYWGPFFTAWLAKSIILRLGGGRLYHRTAPLFAGLVIGQVFTLTVVHPLLTLLPGPGWERLPNPMR
jgi:hypothetical protein